MNLKSLMTLANIMSTRHNMNSILATLRLRMVKDHHRF